MLLRLLGLFLLVLLLVGPVMAQDAVPHPERRGLGVLPLPPRAPGDGAGGLDARRSLFVTDIEVIKGFTFEKTMRKLVGGNGTLSQAEELNRARALFKKWWQTQGSDASVGISCSATFNGFPYQCPRSESLLANADPFQEKLSDGRPNPDFFFPIAVVNRFDLSEDRTTGIVDRVSDCGEHRIIYAKASGRTNSVDRLLIIFEAILPNPKPQLGREGCRALVEEWATLSKDKVSDQVTGQLRDMKSADRAAILERIFYDGLPGFQPVVEANHYGNAHPDKWMPQGQIRTNQFAKSNAGERWLLREFRVSTSGSEVKIVPEPVKGNPWGPLFSKDQPDPKRTAFQLYFLGQVESLVNPKLDQLSLSIPARFTPGDSFQQTGTQGDYPFHASTNKDFMDKLQLRLTELADAGILADRSLTAEHIVNRATALSCGGCHNISNNVDMGGGAGAWPSSLGFTHESERDADREKVQVAGATEERYKISSALETRFLVTRKDLLERFLNKKTSTQ